MLELDPLHIQNASSQPPMLRQLMQLMELWRCSCLASLLLRQLMQLMRACCWTHLCAEAEVLGVELESSDSASLWDPRRWGRGELRLFTLSRN